MTNTKFNKGNIKNIGEGKNQTEECVQWKIRRGSIADKELCFLCQFSKGHNADGTCILPAKCRKPAVKHIQDTAGGGSASALAGLVSA